MSEETVYKAEEARKLPRDNGILAYLIIGIGLLLLAGNLFGFDLMDVLWPGFIIAPGLLLLWPAYNSTPEDRSRFGFLAVPGALIATTGIMLAMMNVTDHFEAWAYSWPLLWASAAWAIMYMHRFEPDNAIHETGRKFIRVMAILFAGLMILFELLIFGNFNPLVPVVLIAYGVFMLAQKRRQSQSS